MKLYGFFVGLLSTLMGVGGGLFSNLLMTFYGRPIHQAVATSSALAVLISIPGALGYVYAGWPAAAHYPDVAALQLPFALGYVSLIGAVLVMPTSLTTAPLGVRAAHAMSKRALEIAFGCYLLIVGSRFVISLWSGQYASRASLLLRVDIRIGIPQNILLHLAHGVARQFVDDEHPLRHLEFRQPAVERLQHRGLARQLRPCCRPRPR